VTDSYFSHTPRSFNARVFFLGEEHI